MHALSLMIERNKVSCVLISEARIKSQKENPVTKRSVKLDRNHRRPVPRALSRLSGEKDQV